METGVENSMPSSLGSGRRNPVIVVLMAVVAAAAAQVSAQDSSPDGISGLEARATAIGVTRLGTPILAVSGTSQADDARPRVLYVLTPMGRQAYDAVAAGLIESILDRTDGRLAFIPTVTAPLPDRDDSARTPDFTGAYPPQGGFYDHPSHPEPRYLWRWIGMESPDLVVELAAGDRETWLIPDAHLPQLRELAARLPHVQQLQETDGLVPRLVHEKPAGVGVIPAVRVVANGPGHVATLDAALSQMRFAPSPAHDELRRRAARSAREVASQLLDVYGKKLDSVQYIPALALIGRLRQDVLDRGPDASPSPIVVRAAAPFVAGDKRSTDGPGGSSVFPGHLVFGELAAMTGKRRFIDLVLAAADAAFDPAGRPREAMPMHNEMSDAVFMGSPILAQAARLTGDPKYADACVRNLRFIQQLCLRDDGLYRHSPLDDAAWGRGNGFPALGLCWSLDELPESFPDRDEMLLAHRAHLTALLSHQDATGCWHQVIDHPESYREFTATAMISYALMRGIQAGRLDAETFGPPADRAWDALKLRIGEDGTLVDVCTGTGKQKSLRDYYDRPAILGHDDRGGAMALLVATERQRYEATKSGSPPSQR